MDLGQTEPFCKLIIEKEPWFYVSYLSYTLQEKSERHYMIFRQENGFWYEKVISEAVQFNDPLNAL